MDTVINRKSKKIKYLTIGGAIFLALALMAYISLTQKQSLNVASDTIIVKSVEMQNFEDFMVFQAKAEPLNAMLVNIIEGGSVQEIFVENGAMVEQSQPLAKLYNPNSELGYLTQETAIIEQMNNLNNGKLNIRNQELDLTKDLVSIEHDFNDAKRLYEVNKTLFEKDIIARNEWQTIAENFRFQQERRNNIKMSIRQEKETNRIQIAQINRSLATMEKSLQILRNNKKNFVVTAPASGRLTSFEPILGQTFAAGESIAKIDVLKGYKLVADVDEFYLDKVTVGQRGSIEYKDKMLDVAVIKVLPEVKGGRFQVELGIDAAKQPDLQQGVSFGVKLNLSGRERVLVLPKGQFHQQTAGKWIFVVDGNKAVRRNITLGRENPHYFEVIAGLKPGEKVVTSAYTDYQNIEMLNLN